MLKTLQEHNKDIMNSLLDRSEPNGIKCPECERNGNISELVDDLLVPVLLTHPPQIKIYCKQCGFTDYRLA